jgi:adenine-specific DNA-methyltransferase
VSIESLDQAEDHLIVAAVTDDGEAMDHEMALRLLTLPGRIVGQPVTPPPDAPLEAVVVTRQETIQRGISERNARLFEAEIDKLEGWADDLKLGLEREIKELDRQIRDARRAATTALTLEEKLAGQKQIKALEAQRNHRRRSLFDAQDQVDRQREEMIVNIEGKLQQKTGRQELLFLRWKLA